jgi:hypothetical protein
MNRASDNLTPPVANEGKTFRDAAPVREPIEEFPNLGDPKTVAVGLLMVLATVGYCVVVHL